MHDHTHDSSKAHAHGHAHAAAAGHTHRDKLDRPVKVGVITCSDTRTTEPDSAGRALIEMSEERGWEVVAYEVVKDDRGSISSAIVKMADGLLADLVVTCGGTGLSPRDVTPEATRDVAPRDVPGVAERIRLLSMEVTRGRAMLSRGVAAQRGRTLIVNLPGSEKAVRESFEFFADQVPHAVEMAAGGGH